MILIYKFFQDIKLNGLLIFLFFSPIFLIYSVAENEALIRKEFILFCIYIVYLNLILNNNKFSFLVILIFLPIMNLIWDGAIFYVYFFFFSFLCKKNIQFRDIILNIFSYIPYLISLYFVITTKSDPSNFEQMCLSINESCFGAMFALDKTLLDILVCPICKGNLTYRQDSQELVCLADKLAFRIEDDIPIMIPEEARNLEIEK